MRLLTAFAVVAIFPSLLSAEEHPLKAAKVGDWIEYKNEMKLTVGKGMNTGMRQTVARKTEKEVGLKIELKMNGKTMASPQESKIPLDEEFDPFNLALRGGSGPKPEKLAEGEETITVAGKKLDCKWIEVKSVAKISGKEIVSVSKFWIAKKDVPLSGVVRMESDTSGQKMLLEATGWGRGK